jgi:hypothetical protein
LLTFFKSIRIFLSLVLKVYLCLPCYSIYYTPLQRLKFLEVFRQNWVVLDIVGETIFPKKLNVKIKRSNCRTLKLFYWKPTSKSCSPSFNGIYKIGIFKHLIGSLFLVKFFIPKFMKIRCYLKIFTTFGCHF